jgi:hypothetical protein
MRRKIPIFKVVMNGREDYSQLTEIPEIIEVVIEETVIAIKDGIEKNKKEASIFMVDYDHYVSLNKNSWKSSLTAAIRYYSNSEKEEYEMCQKCVDLINSIDKRELKLYNHEQGV